MQFISRLLLCGFDVVSFAKKVQNGEFTKACCGGGGELRFRGGYARFGGGRTVGWTCTRPAGGEVLLREFGGAGGGGYLSVYLWEQVDASMSTMSCCKFLYNRQTLLATLLFTNSLDFRKMFRKMIFREDQKDDVLKICNDGSMHC